MMRDDIAKIVEQVSQVLLGKERQIKLALACLLADGHLLIEDLPGMGKTTLAHALAAVLGLDYQRVQFTSDMLPADIIGVGVFDNTAGQFNFHPGPIFTQILLADEINRTTPKTQSALLEAMEEHQVTAEGETRPLPQPFFVIATQNPQTQMGTFALPESQLDRFLMRISLGYPSLEAEKILFQGGDPRRRIKNIPAVLNAQALAELKHKVRAVNASEGLIDYLQRLVQATRNNQHFAHGLSPRAALGLLSAAKAWAYMHGRDYLVPEDIQTVLPAVVTHRIALDPGEPSSAPHRLISELLARVDILT